MVTGFDIAIMAAVGFAVAVLPTGKRHTNSLGMEFVRIAPGTFMMGHEGSRLSEQLLNPAEPDGQRRLWLPENGDYDEHPAHRVTISKPFHIGVYEVTNEQYERFDPLHAYLRGKFGFSIDPDEAVVFVSWHAAKAFCDWLSHKEGLPYRLPTEAEWEYACRAGTSTLFSTGETLPDEFLKNPSSCWYPDPRRGRGRAEVVPLHVGTTPPNPWGLCDMHGNVEEWCHDWYGRYEAHDQVDPLGRADGDFKVTRGGSHSTFAFYLRCANRMGALPEDESWYIGLRVVLGEAPTGKPLPVMPAPGVQHNVRQRRPARAAKTPDPCKPYFKGPIEYVRIPEGSQGPLFSHHNHDPAIAQCPNGDLFAIWYTTHTERGREVAVAASRLRFGQEEWEPACPLWDTPDRNDHCPGLWFDGKQTLYHFNSVSAAATWGPLAVIMRTSTDNGATWSRARLIMPEHVGRHMVIPGIFRAADGAIVLPCDASSSGGAGTALHISRDEGKTWVDPGGTIAGIHAGVAQLRDGRLLAFGRGDDIEGKMPQSVSSDLGKSWTYSPSPFPPIGGGQRVVLMTVREGPPLDRPRSGPAQPSANTPEPTAGPLLFISFANEPIMITDASGKQRPVQGMFAALSHDDGKTWPRIRLVSDDGPGREAKTTDGAPFILSHSSAEPRGYLAACQGADGLIHLISSWNYYCFNLNWMKLPVELPPPSEPVAQFGSPEGGEHRRAGKPA